MPLNRERAGQAEPESGQQHGGSTPSTSRSVRQVAPPLLDMNSSPTREIVTLAYQLILGVPPSSELQIDRAAQCTSISLLRQFLLNSPNFRLPREEAFERPFVFFIHIPKTAGGSLRRYFRVCFGEACRWFAKNPNAGDSTMRRRSAFNAKEHVAKYRVSGGHIHFKHVPDSLKEQQPIFVAVLRDPVQRILSQYNFLRTQWKNVRGDAARSGFAELKKMTLYEALTHKESFRSACDRLQLKFLGGPDLAGAEQALNSHRFIVGKQEYLSDFMQVLEDRLSLPSAGGGRQVHRAGADYLAEIAAQPRYNDAIELLTKMNADEFTLYNSFGNVWTNLAADLSRDPGKRLHFADHSDTAEKTTEADEASNARRKLRRAARTARRLESNGEPVPSQSRRDARVKQRRERRKKPRASNLQDDAGPAG